MDKKMLADAGDSIKVYLDAAKNAEALNKKKPVKAPYKERFTLLFQYQLKLKQTESELNKFNLRQTFLTGKRHFCKKSLNELKPISIRDLMVPKVHLNSYLMCRTINKARSIVGVMAVVEDLNGDVEEIALYNCMKGLDDDADKFLPIGTIMLIKEPYMKYGSLGQNTVVRVDSPTDVIFLDETDEILKNTIWYSRCTISYEKLKSKGNEYFNKNEFDEALKWYSKAIRIEKHAKLYLNRAVTFLKLERFYEAYEDAKQSFEIEKSEKALFRMGKAAYGMRKWELAVQHFQQLIELYPSNLGVKEDLIKSKSRLNESATGKYDWFKMHKEFDLSPILDYADYQGPVRIENIKDKGKGLIATRDISKGELLLVSKAVSLTYASECKDILLIAMNMINNKMDKNIQTINMMKVTNKLKNNPYMAQEVYGLYAGDLDRNETIPFGIIDSGRIEQIYSCNSFAADRFDLVDTDEKNDSSGFWILPSYMNHSCLPNTSRFFYGDVMSLHALDYIKQGEEITCSYLATDDTYQERKMIMQHFMFDCTCRLCKLDSQDQEYNYRTSLIEDKHVKNKKLSQIKISKSFLPNTIQLVNEIKETYTNRNDLKFQLILPLNMMAVAYAKNSQFDKAISAWKEILDISEGISVHIEIVTLFKIAQIYALIMNEKVARKTMKKAFEVSKLAYGDTIDSFKTKFVKILNNTETYNLI